MHVSHITAVVNNTKLHRIQNTKAITPHHGGGEKKKKKMVK